MASVTMSEVLMQWMHARNGGTAGSSESGFTWQYELTKLKIMRAGVEAGF